jgi:hypothetical protein
MLAEPAWAQEIEFDRIDRFESVGTGTLHVGGPPKTTVDGERHLVILTILQSDAETKVYLKSPDGDVAQTTSYRGKAFRHSKPLEN